MNEERLHALDSLRAMAMFLGIVLHAAGSFMWQPFPWIVHDVGRSQAFDLVIIVIHGFRMQLFFLLAGFFAHFLWQRMGARPFIEQRLRRIGIPFAVGMVTLLPLMGLIWHWTQDYAPLGVLGQLSDEMTSSLPTAHLWFLQMLLFLYAGAVLVAWAGAKLGWARFLPRIDAAFDRFVGTAWMPVLLIPPTVLCLWGAPVLGEPDMMGARFWPSPRAVAYFGLFFAFGWWLHRRREKLDTLRAHVAAYFIVAVAVFVAFIAFALFNAPLPALVAWAAYSWLMTFGLTGLFLRIASRSRPWMRYLADSSYWCYLAHLPLILWLQVLVATSSVNAWLKFLFIVACTFALLLASYHAFVRYTWIGRGLNGPRQRPGATAGIKAPG